MTKVVGTDGFLLAAALVSAKAILLVASKVFWQADRKVVKLDDGLAAWKGFCGAFVRAALMVL